MGGGGGGSGSGENASSGVFLTSELNCSKFSAYCRETAVNAAPDLQHCRVFVKCIAVRCILIALTHINGNIFHTDLGAARAETSRRLRSIPEKHTSRESLAQVPRYLPLFLTDIMNLTCSCATYTIDDKPVLMLQCEAMTLMRQVVNLFLWTEDPDAKLVAANGCGDMSSDVAAADSAEAVANIVQSRILHQFTSQLLSAVRSGLSNTNTLCSPDLLYSAGTVISVAVFIVIVIVIVIVVSSNVLHPTSLFILFYFCTRNFCFITFTW
jgi:hypothetical protein